MKNLYFGNHQLHLQSITVLLNIAIPYCSTENLYLHHIYNYMQNIYTPEYLYSTLLFMSKNRKIFVVYFVLTNFV